MVAPKRKQNNLSQRLPGTENSLTTTSVHAMYTKVPAAKLENTTSTISPALDAAIPIPIPIGVAIEKIIINYLTKRKSFGKALTKLMPSAEPAAPL